MPPKSRKNAQPIYTGSLPPASNSMVFPRATSPSSSFTSFLNKAAPKKWFTRSASPRSVSATLSQTSSVGTLVEPRASGGSGWSRKHTISGPSDPRPILSNQEGKLGASSSVLDLTLKASPPSSSNDLRNISQRPYSRSVDDLTRFAPPSSPGSISQQQTRERIQMYRKGSAASSVNSITPSPNEGVNLSNYPFPTLSASPPTSSSLSLLSNSRTVPTISVSTPSAVPEKHARSQSTNLLSPAGSQSPSQCQAPLPIEKERKPIHTGGFGAHFGFSGKTSEAIHDSPNNTALHLPVISLPDENGDDRRSSQIILHQGFINRVSSFSAPSLASANLIRNHFQSPGLDNSLRPSVLLPPVISTHSLPKGWKPFKLILKGSKLYFYKPPSWTSTNSIKELFPTNLTDVVEEPLEEVSQSIPATFDLSSISRKTPEKETGSSRRKRAYWGRSTHPDLVVQEGCIEKGSGEALVHEAVFGTTFRGDQPSEWECFALSVMLLLPLPNVFGKEKFELEFQRCKAYYVSGSPEERRTEAEARVKWLDDAYKSLQPTDPHHVESPPPAAPAVFPERPYRPRSSSINAMADNPSFGNDNGTVISGMEDSTLPSFASSLAPPPGLTSAKFNLSTEALLRLDTNTLATSLEAIHVRDIRTLRRMSQGDIVNILSKDADYEQPSLVAFQEMTGTDDHPHWLTRFVVNSLLNLSSLSSPLSKTHIRATLLSKWIRTAEFCRTRGDMASWRAISSALTCRSIARLEKSWRRMEEHLEKLVRDWVLAPQCLATQSFWIDEDIHTIMSIVKSSDVDEKAIVLKPLTECADFIRRVQKNVMSCQTRNDSSISEEAQRLILTFDSIRASEPPKACDIHRYLPQSLAVEPRSRSHYASHFWTRTSVPSPQSLIPLMFPEALPAASLLDRNVISRAKKDSLENGRSNQVMMIDDSRVNELIKLKTDTSRRRGALPREFAMTSPGPRYLESNPTDFPGTVFSLFDGDLLLIADPTPRHTATRPLSLATTSRPSSIVSNSTRPCSVISEAESSVKKVARAPSLRVTSRSAAALERKISVTRRSSLPSISQRASLAVSENIDTGESPLRVTVKAGTLDCLVDILISGVEDVCVSFADDHGEMPLTARSRRVELDKQDFDWTFWNVFRSFVTPIVLFELLRKRYLAGLPNKSTLSEQHRVPIPCIDVVNTLKEWLVAGGGMQDILDDHDLYASLKQFIKDTSENPSSVTDPALLKALKSLHVVAFMHSKRPELHRQAWVEKVPTSGQERFGSGVPDPDTISPEDLVESLNAIVAPGAPIEDFLVASDMLEVQTLDKMGWFLQYEPPSQLDEVGVQSLLTVMQHIPPSTLLTDIHQETFYKALPPSIRSFIRSHAVISKWAIAKLVEPNIGPRREARMHLFLSAIEICRPRPDVTRACVRTFVEAALTSAILSPESRLFHRAWYNVARTRNCSLDSLSAFLITQTSRHQVPDLRPDVGWILERMLEIISLPDTFESGQGGLNLVNFAKRRHLCSLVLTTPAKIQQSDYDRLNNIYNQVSKIEFDFRAIQLEAMRENGQWIQTQKRSPRPFQRLIVVQQEKIRRDRTLRERLSKEKKAEEQRQEQWQNNINRAMQPRKAPVQFTKQQRSKRTMSSAFFRVMRPISTAFSSDNLVASGQRLTAAELDFLPSGKPSVVINLADARVAAFNNPERPYTFQLDTEDGGQYLLQATSKTEMLQWLKVISQTVTTATSKRMTYLKDLTPQVADHMPTRAPTMTRHPVAVFGVNLTYLLKREARSDSIPLGVIPIAIEKCLDEVEKRGLHEVGIYRVAGQTSITNAMRDAFDRGESVDLSSDRYLDINSVCDNIKAYFRMLPEALFPEHSYWEVVRVMKILDFEQRLSQVRKIVHDLPLPNYYLLRRLMEHLERVTDFEELNQMTSNALAIVFAPNLLRGPGSDFSLAISNINFTTQMVKTLISHFHVVFNEAEMEQDDDEIDGGEGEEGEEHLDAVDEGDEEGSMSPVHDAIHDNDLELDPSLDSTDR